MRLLLADDDPMMRDLLEAVLSANGHSLLMHGDGNAVWASFQEAPTPMVVLDWQMPGLDGLEVCRRIRAHPAGADTYILMVTARGGMDDLDAVLDAGADDYLSKPVTAQDIAARLRIAEKRMEVGQLRRRAEEDLQKSKYLAGIGEVSLALQHEINNPLAALLTNTALLASGMLHDHEVKESLTTIDEQARRIADVVRRLGSIDAPRSVEYMKGQRMVDLGATPVQGTKRQEGK